MQTKKLNRIQIIAFTFLLLCSNLTFSQYTFPEKDSDWISLSLNINSEHRDTLYKDQPALLAVSLSNAEAFYLAGWNQEAKNYLASLKQQFEAGEIEEEYYNKEQEVVTNEMKPIKSFTIGDKSSPWFQQIELEVRDTLNKVVESNFIQNFTISF